MRPKTKKFAVKFRCICKFSPCKFCEKFWAHIIDFRVQKWSCLLFTSDTIQKQSCFPWNSDACSEAFGLQVLQKKFWVQFHDLCVQKRSCFLWNSDACGKFSACKFCRKSSGRNFRFMCIKTKLFPVKFRRMLQFSACKFCRASSGCNFTIYVSKNEAVCREIQMHFRSSPLARFTEKVLGAISRFMCPKMKLFAMIFRRIFQVLRLQGSQNKFWAHIYDLCVQKRSCLLWSWDAFSKISSCKVHRISSGHIFTIYVSKIKAVCCVVQTHFGRFLLVG